MLYSLMKNYIQNTYGEGNAYNLHMVAIFHFLNNFIITTVNSIRCNSSVENMIKYQKRVRWN